MGTKSVLGEQGSPKREGIPRLAFEGRADFSLAKRWLLGRRAFLAGGESHLELLQLHTHLFFFF